MRHMLQCETFLVTMRGEVPIPTSYGKRRARLGLTY